MLRNISSALKAHPPFMAFGGTLPDRLGGSLPAFLYLRFGLPVIEVIECSRWFSRAHGASSRVMQAVPIKASRKMT